MVRAAIFALLAALFGASFAGPGLSGDRYIILQATTSTQNTGLLDDLAQAFGEETGIELRTVAVGTGQAIRNARNGEADVLLVHDRASEERFVAEGYGVARFDIMYNDFVIVGPISDPAGVAGSRDAVASLRKIALAETRFASRGDDSGTHKAELRLWREAEIDPTEASGSWYLEMGSGMGATLNAGTGLGAYVLTDRGTWIAFGNKHGYDTLVEDDSRLFNQYGVILVNPERHPHVRAADGQAFVDWVRSESGQERIGRFRVNGQQLFFPNAE